MLSAKRSKQSRRGYVRRKKLISYALFTIGTIALIAYSMIGPFEIAGITIGNVAMASFLMVVTAIGIYASQEATCVEVKMMLFGPQRGKQDKVTHYEKLKDSVKDIEQRIKNR